MKTFERSETYLFVLEQFLYAADVSQLLLSVAMLAQAAVQFRRAALHDSLEDEKNAEGRGYSSSVGSGEGASEGPSGSVPSGEGSASSTAGVAALGSSAGAGAGTSFVSAAIATEVRHARMKEMALRIPCEVRPLSAYVQFQCRVEA